MYWRYTSRTILLSRLTVLNLQAQQEAQVSASNLAMDKLHQKRSFQDEAGRIFWNVELPVYLSISPTPDAKDTYAMKRVQNEAMKEHANPMCFDDHGIHYIRHLDYKHHVPENEVSFEVFVDGRKPISKASFLGAPKYVKSGTIYYGVGLKTSLDVEDEMSGVQNIFFSRGEDQYSSYSTALEFGQEGPLVLGHYAVDNVGNIETARLHKFIVDLTAPETVMEFKGDQVENFLSHRMNVTLTSQDALAGVNKTWFQLDDGQQWVYSRTFNLSTLKDGEHVLTYFSTDRVENQEEPQKFKFYLDRIAPEVKAELVGDVYRGKDRTYISGKTTVKLNATDNKAGVNNVYFSVNGKEAKKYTSEFPLEEAQGIHYIKFWAEDKVNNVSKVKTDADLGNLYLDLTSPKMGHVFAGAKFYTLDTMFITSDTKIKLEAYDAQSGVDRVNYQVVGKGDHTHDAPFNLNMDGLHTIAFKGRDRVGNTSEDQFFFVLDNEAPEIFSHLSIDAIGIQKLTDKEKEIPVCTKHAMLYLAATDEQVGTDKILYSIDGGAEREYVGPIKTNRAGLWLGKIRALDKLGNEQVNEVFEFVIQ